MSSDTPSSWPGTLLTSGQTLCGGRYTIDRYLGGGGMGEVYGARHKFHPPVVAIKILYPPYAKNKDTLEAFQREAEVAGKLNHDHIVRVYDYGFDDAGRAPYLVMDLLEGRTLARLVEEEGAQAPEIALDHVWQVAAALDAVHHASIVHRDLKPENLFLTDQGIVKVLDFGLIKVLDATSRDTLLAKGSPHFMSPEQWETRAVSPQTDIWALGLVAFFLLTGRHFWRAAAATETSLQALRGEVQELADRVPSACDRAAEYGTALPAAFDAFFARCVAYEASARFPSAGEAARALAVALAPGAALPPPARPPVAVAHDIASAATMPSVGPPSSTAPRPAPRDDRSGAPVSSLAGHETEGLALRIMAGVMLGVATALAVLLWRPWAPVETGSPEVAAGPVTPSNVVEIVVQPFRYSYNGAQLRPDDCNLQGVVEHVVYQKLLANRASLGGADSPTPPRVTLLEADPMLVQDGCRAVQPRTRPPVDDPAVPPPCEPLLEALTPSAAQSGGSPPEVPAPTPDDAGTQTVTIGGTVHVTMRASDDYRWSVKLTFTAGAASRSGGPYEIHNDLLSWVDRPPVLEPVLGSGDGVVAIADSVTGGWLSFMKFYRVMKSWRRFERGAGDFEPGGLDDLDFPLARITRAQICGFWSDSCDALKVLVEGAENSPGASWCEDARLSDVDQHLCQAQLYRATAEPARAIEELTRASHMSGSLGVAYEQAEAYFHAGQVDSAIRSYESIIRQLGGSARFDPAITQALNHAALSYAYRGDFDSARAATACYLHMSSGASNAHDTHADVLMLEGRIEAALAAQEEAVAAKKLAGDHDIRRDQLKAMKLVFVDGVARDLRAETDFGAIGPDAFEPARSGNEYAIRYRLMRSIYARLGGDRARSVGLLGDARRLAGRDAEPPARYDLARWDDALLASTACVLRDASGEPRSVPTCLADSGFDEYLQQRRGFTRTRKYNHLARLEGLIDQLEEARTTTGVAGHEATCSLVDVLARDGGELFELQSSMGYWSDVLAGPVILPRLVEAEWAGVLGCDAARIGARAGADSVYRSLKYGYAAVCLGPQNVRARLWRAAASAAGLVFAAQGALQGAQLAVIDAACVPRTDPCLNARSPVEALGACLEADLALVTSRQPDAQAGSPFARNVEKICHGLNSLEQQLGEPAALASLPGSAREHLCRLCSAAGARIASCPRGVER